MVRGGWVRIAAELVPVVAMLVCLGLSLGLLGVVLRRPLGVGEKVAARERPEAESGRRIEERRDESESRKATDLAVCPEPDLVAGEWLALMAWIGEQEGLCQEAEERARAVVAKAEAVEQEAAEAEAEAVGVGEQLNARVGGIAAQERARAVLAVERDALRRRRDLRRVEVEAARAQARGVEAYAVVPTLGPRGTWRQPVVLDCRERQVRLLPDGPTFGPMDWGGGGVVARSSRMAAAVRRAAEQAAGKRSADGGPMVPYLLFLIRPDGIRSYYEARAALESLGIAFGYELVDADWEIEVPEGSRGGSGEAGLAEAGGWGGGSADRGEELPVWTGEESGGGGLPEGPRGWRIGFAEALDAELGEEGSGIGRQVDDPSGLGRGDGRREAEGSLEGPKFVAQAWGMEPPVVGRGVSEQRAGGSADEAGVVRGREPGAGEASGGGGELGVVSGRGSGGPAVAEGWTGEVGGGAARATVGSAERTAEGGAGGGEGGGSSGFGLAGAGRGPGGWYDIRVVCEADGVVVQPGGYRLTKAGVESGELLLPRVRDLARRGAWAADGTPLVPRLRFVVAAGGEAMFWEARRQTTFAGLEWPATLQVAESGRPSGLLGVGAEVLSR